jgi:DNA-binding GntR family transcriptional regulator
MDESKNRRASDHAYLAIKKAIIEHKFKPGEKLGKQAMAALCGVSVIPVIDALNRLEGEGLVESNPYNGARVARIDAEKLADMFILREAIEVQVVRMLCFTIGRTELEALHKTAKTIDAMAGLKDKTSDYDDLHYQFHLALAKNAGSKNLIAGIERLQFFSLLAEAEKTYTNLDSRRLSTEYAHGDIITAIMKRNPDEAQAIMRKHIYRSHILEAPYWV